MRISDEKLRQYQDDLIRRQIARAGSLQAVAESAARSAIMHMRIFFGVDGHRIQRNWKFSPAVEQRASELCDELEELFAAARVRPIPGRLAEIAQTDDAFQSFMDLAKPKS
jgi:hypothetical protein